MRNLIRILMLVILTVPLAAEKRNFSYMYSRGGKMHILSGGSVTISSIGKLAKRWQGDYLWVKKNGSEWLIRDQAVLAEVARAFAPVQALSPRYDELHGQMRPLEKRQQELEERVEDLEEKIDAETDDNDNPDEAAVREWERQMRIFEEELRPLESRLRELEREEEKIDDLQESREDVAEDELERIIDRAIRSGAAQKL